MIKNELEQIKNSCTLQNKTTLWDYIKCQIRTVTISYSISKSKKSKEKEIEVITNPEKRSSVLSV